MANIDIQLTSSTLDQIAQLQAGSSASLSDLMGQLIEKAKSEGSIRQDLPTEVVLFTVYARSCDPTLDYLRMGDQYTDDQVIHFLLTTCFDGLH